MQSTHEAKPLAACEFQAPITLQKGEEMNKSTLHCVEYRISRGVGFKTTIDVKFVIPVNHKNSEETAEALKKIELLLGSSKGVNFVQGSDKPRCCWCGVLAGEDDKVCTRCGGAL